MEVGRWKGFDPKWNYSETPYASMGNNPVRNTDVLGDTIVINLFGSYDEAIYHQAANNAVLNQIDDGVFLVFGHGRAGAIQYEGKRGVRKAVESAIAPNGYVNYGTRNGKATTIGVRQTTAKEHVNTFKGSWETYKNGKKIGKQLDAFMGNLNPPRTGPYKK